MSDKQRRRSDAKHWNKSSRTSSIADSQPPSHLTSRHTTQKENAGASRSSASVDDAVTDNGGTFKGHTSRSHMRTHQASQSSPAGKDETTGLPTDQLGPDTSRRKGSSTSAKEARERVRKRSSGSGVSLDTKSARSQQRAREESLSSSERRTSKPEIAGCEPTTASPDFEQAPTRILTDLENSRAPLSRKTSRTRASGVPSCDLAKLATLPKPARRSSAGSAPSDSGPEKTSPAEKSALLDTPSARAVFQTASDLSLTLPVDHKPPAAQSPARRRVSLCCLETRTFSVGVDNANVAASSPQLRIPSQVSTRTGGSRSNKEDGVDATPRLGPRYISRRPSTTSTASEALPAADRQGRAASESSLQSARRSSGVVLSTRACTGTGSVKSLPPRTSAPREAASPSHQQLERRQGAGRSMSIDTILAPERALSSLYHPEAPFADEHSDVRVSVTREPSLWSHTPLSSPAAFITVSKVASPADSPPANIPSSMLDNLRSVAYRWGRSKSSVSTPLSVHTPSPVQSPPATSPSGQDQARENRTLRRLREMALGAVHMPGQLPGQSSHYLGKAVERPCTFAFLASMLAVVALATALVALHFFWSWSPIVPDGRLCKAYACREHASQLGAQHDSEPGAQPCVDFGRFVCSRWPRRHEQAASVHEQTMIEWLKRVSELARSQPSYSAPSTAGRAAAMTAACMSRDRLDMREETETVRWFMRSLGLAFPDTRRLLESADYPGVVRTFAVLAVHWRLPLWFDLELVMSPRGSVGNGGKRVVYVTPSRLAYPFARLHSRIADEPVLDSYSRRVSSTVFSDEDWQGGLKDRSRDVQSSIMGNLSKAVVGAARPSAKPWLGDVKGLTRFVHHLEPEDWLHALRSAFGAEGTGAASATIQLDDRVYVSDVRLLGTVESLFWDHTAADIAAHTSWWVAQVLAPLASEDVFGAVRTVEFFGALVQALMCAVQVESVYNVLLAVLERERLEADARTSLARLFERLRSVALRKAVSSSKIGNAALKTFVSVAKNGQAVLWPEDSGDTSHEEDLLRALYGNASESPSNDGFIERWLSSRRALRRSLGTAARDNASRVFRADQFSVVSHDPIRHVVSLWTALLASPFYADEGTAAMLYGGIGFLFARELFRMVGTAVAISKPGDSDITGTSSSSTSTASPSISSRQHDDNVSVGVATSGADGRHSAYTSWNSRWTSSWAWDDDNSSAEATIREAVDSDSVESLWTNPWTSSWQSDDESTSTETASGGTNGNNSAGSPWTRSWTAGGASGRSESGNSSTWPLLITACLEEGVFPDLPALEATYETYLQYRREGYDAPLMDLENYTPEQVFFMTVCHGSCHVGSDKNITSEACTTAMKNFKPFALAFGCPYGSPMNPVERCEIF